MKKIFILLITFFIFSYTHAVSSQDLDTAIYKLSKQIMVLDPYQYDDMETYMELAYLKRKYKLDYLKIYDTLYRDRKAYNNYYYDQYILYSKFLSDSAVVTEDCLNIPGSIGNLHVLKKLLFYALYPETIKIPSNYIEQLEELSTVAEFIGPYKTLQIIYYLKKYNYQNLSDAQKSKLTILENHLSALLYNKYVKDKPWSSLHILSLKVLKLNEYSMVKDIDISKLVEMYKQNKPIDYFDDDMKYVEIIGNIGGTNILGKDGNALLWIFLMEYNKK